MNIHWGNNKLCPIWSQLIQVKCEERWYRKSKKGPGGWGCRGTKKNEDSIQPRRV